MISKVILIIIAICIIYYLNKPDYLLQKYHEIFPLHINDMILPINLENDKNYDIIMKSAPRELTNDELIYLLKYKKFVDLKGIYSMCAPEEIYQTQLLVENVIKKSVPGCIIETGVWRGGMAMYIQAMFKYYDVYRDLLLFDTFGEFPESTNSKDKYIHNITKVLFEHAPTLNDVKRNFKRFNLLNKNIKFIAGDIMKTVPKTPLNSIAILRCDCDYYDCTKIILETYYWKINRGGYIIIDDYNNEYVACKEAVDSFRKRYSITKPIIDTHGGSVYWQV